MDSYTLKTNWIILNYLLCSSEKNITTFKYYYYSLFVSWIEGQHSLLFHFRLLLKYLHATIIIVNKYSINVLIKLLLVLPTSNDTYDKKREEYNLFFRLDDAKLLEENFVILHNLE